MRAKRGFTLMELVLVLGAVGLFIALVFFVYNRVTEGTEVQDRLVRTQTLVSELEKVKVDNGGKYPQGTCDISGCSLTPSWAPNYLSTYYWSNGWTYTCSAGNNPRIEIGNVEDDKVGSKIVGGLTSSLSSYGINCTYDAGAKKITCTLGNRGC